jgi:hypothetical protein
MSTGEPDIDDEQWDSDDANPTWEAVDSNKQRFWKLESTYTDVNEFIPYPALVRTDDKYVQLRKVDIEGNRLRNVKTEEPLGAAYISNTCFKDLKDGSFDFSSGVPIRTREGSPAFAEAVRTTTRGKDPQETTKGLAWSTFFDNGVKATSKYIPIRFVNPKIDVILRPLSAVVTAKELLEIVVAIKGTTRQNVTVWTDTVAALSNKDFIIVCDPDSHEPMCD